jgi:hypothetical protein
MRIGRWSRSARFAVVSGVVVAAAGCWYLFAPPTYAVPPGPAAHDRACAEVVSSLPDVVLGRDRDRVDGAGAAAWGDATVILRCGVTPPPPTTNLCVNVDGVDWVLNTKRDMGDDRVLLTTYGRVPAVEMTVDASVGHYGGALASVNDALDGIPQTHRCHDLADVS